MIHLRKTLQKKKQSFEKSIITSTTINYYLNPQILWKDIIVDMNRRKN